MTGVQTCALPIYDNKSNVESNVLIVTHGITLMMLKLFFEEKSIDAIVKESVSPNGVIHHYYFDDKLFVRKT